MPHIWTWSAHDTEIGLTLLKRAAEIDPNYARAHSLLAWGHAARAYLGRAEPTAELETALTMARRAIDQDGEDPWAHLAMGYVHMVSRRPQPAFSELKQTIELNSSFAFGHMILGSAYGYAGMVDEGLHELALATRLSPRDHLHAATLSTTGLCDLMPKRFAPRPSSTGQCSCGPISGRPGARWPRPRGWRASPILPSAPWRKPSGCSPT